MKTKAILTILLLGILLTASAAVDSEGYERNVSNFKAYLMGEDVLSLDELYKGFEESGTYKWSQQFALYVDILRLTEQNEFGKAEVRLTVLKANDQFCAFFNTELGMIEKKIAIEDLEEYVAARKAEFSGDKVEAVKRYGEVTHFLDATSRMSDLLDLISEKQETYRAALGAFKAYISGENSVTLTEVKKAFEKADGYQNSSTYLKCIDILKAVEEQRYSDLKDLIQKTEVGEEVYTELLELLDEQLLKNFLEYLKAIESFSKAHMDTALIQLLPMPDFLHSENLIRFLEKNIHKERPLVKEASIAGAYFAKNGELYHMNETCLELVNDSLYTPEETPNTENGEIGESAIAYMKSITVYYGVNSRKYHRTAECQYMTKEIYKHTLYDALYVDGKEYCTLCNPMTEADVRSQISVLNGK